VCAFCLKKFKAIFHLFIIINFIFKYETPIFRLLNFFKKILDSRKALELEFFFFIIVRAEAQERKTTLVSI
jgi:glutathione peroxidase-family protein